MTNDKALEAAARVLVPIWYGGFEDRGWLNPPGTPNARAVKTAQAVISAYLSALPGGADVVGLAERLNQWRSETVNQWSDEYEPRTSWEKQVSDAMKEWYEASTQASSALQTMQARAEAAERERDEYRAKNAVLDADGIAARKSAASNFARAEAADARVKELEEALEFYAKSENYKGEFIPGGYTDRGTFEIAHHVNIVRKDAGEIARTALKGGSNG